MRDAESRGANEMFARSNKQRAFARCMGDDMSLSSAGFADPAVTGIGDVGPDRKRRAETGGEELMWDEAAQ